MSYTFGITTKADREKWRGEERMYVCIFMCMGEGKRRVRDKKPKSFIYNIFGPPFLITMINFCIILGSSVEINFFS